MASTWYSKMSQLKNEMQENLILTYRVRVEIKANKQASNYQLRSKGIIINVNNLN